jgi:hypothetical protein
MRPVFGGDQSPSARAVGFADRRLAAEASPSNPQIAPTIAGLNRDAKANLADDRRRRRLSRAALGFRFGLSGLYLDNHTTTPPGVCLLKANAGVPQFELPPLGSLTPGEHS